ncbi:hypothetical protein SARC_14141 [Sphaeroforma arctica JP610]|uniref:Flavodoxin-like domain-containing protein n=1 Tax=Sphaeroforma arctica JP610 TaxID=667725 RepID=A0A0L0F996_9EUKA|nr:hypothetical protein SARC_14141 [Sphaeroforma arctica JP610]KNC73299.1 hypothetical protein SARC_14141 [Sphaeroforma arctica JP610]|eukprot:XP_014147201.1 hypothetical protein SARC_14141 [Sphaeroforma arctica JP610]
MTLSYTILGLGDTNYSHFNQFAKDLHRRLQTLQASCFLDVGYADDALGLENVVEPWKKTLYAHLTNSVAAQTVSSTSSLTSRAMSVAGVPPQLR